MKKLKSSVPSITQKTVKGKTIPIPERSEVMANLKRAAKGKPGTKMMRVGGPSPALNAETRAIMRDGEFSDRLLSRTRKPGRVTPIEDIPELAD